MDFFRFFLGKITESIHAEDISGVILQPFGKKIRLDGLNDQAAGEMTPERQRAKISPPRAIR